MGIFLRLYVSQDVTPKEWEKAYLATLPLVEKLPLMEFRDKTPKGYSMLSGAKTAERELYHGLGWRVVGDYQSYNTAEDFVLYRKIPLQENEEYFDPILLLGAEQSIIDFRDERIAGKYLEFWDSKTQGELYHVFLLAIACYMAEILQDKLVIGGDITRGQCKMAVNLLEDLLGKKVNLPIQCDCERLYSHTRKLPLTQSEILEFFLAVYNGTLTKEVSDFVQTHFTDEEIYLYWKNRFTEYPVNSIGFHEVLRDFLYMDCAVSDIAKYVDIGTDDGKDVAEKIIKNILDSELHIKDKDCKDVLTIDKDAEGTYSIYTLLAGVVFSGAHNWRVDRYIPIDELRKEIATAFGNVADTDSIIDNYLEEQRKKANDITPEKNPDKFLKSRMDSMLEMKKAEDEEYDISDYNQLRFFENGDTFSPNVWENTLSMFKFYLSATEEERLQKLKNEGAESCINFLCQNNRSVILLGDDWDKIFEKIKSDVEIFNRYYPAVRVEVTSNNVEHILRAFVLNDELWNFLNASAKTTAD